VEQSDSFSSFHYLAAFLQSSKTHFSPTWRFFKPSLSPARTRFKEMGFHHACRFGLNTEMIVPIYAKASIYMV
jgi:hypothetical protein